jgi:osmotically-inducible protein OsmY
MGLISDKYFLIMKCTSICRGLMLAITMTLVFAACKPSDEKIAQEVTAKLTALSPSISATVKDGVATISGEVTDEATKAAAATALQGIKGLKSVVNNLTVPPPPPPPVVINPDNVLRASIDSVFSAKGITGVTSTVADGVVTLTGTIKKADLQKVMKAANELKPKKVLNQMTLK